MRCLRKACCSNYWWWSDTPYLSRHSAFGQQSSRMRPLEWREMKRGPSSEFGSQKKLHTTLTDVVCSLACPPPQFPGSCSNAPSNSAPHPALQLFPTSPFPPLHQHSFVGFSASLTASVPMLRRTVNRALLADTFSQSAAISACRVRIRSAAPDLSKFFNPPQSSVKP